MKLPRSPLGFKRCVAVVVLWLASGFQATAQTTPNLADSLEELMSLRVQEVFGESDRLQPSPRSPPRSM